MLEGKSNAYRTPQSVCLREVRPRLDAQLPRLDRTPGQVPKMQKPGLEWCQERQSQRTRDTGTERRNLRGMVNFRLQICSLTK